MKKNKRRVQWVSISVHSMPPSSFKIHYNNMLPQHNQLLKLLHYIMKVDSKMMILWLLMEFQ